MEVNWIAEFGVRVVRCMFSWKYGAREAGYVAGQQGQRVVISQRAATNWAVQ